MRPSCWCVAAVLAFGCGTSPQAQPDDGSSSGGSGTIGGNVKDSGKSNASDHCSDAAKLVYVVSTDDNLYSFTPNKTAFKLIGKLACPAPDGVTPNSMAIDRQGTAWINFTDGSLFKASTGDASCQATSFVPGQAGFLKFGMAFAADAADSEKETLFIAGLGEVSSTGYGLGVIDQKTLKLTMLGNYGGTLEGLGAELTGTGDGKLYGFFTTAPATLAEINKTTGVASNLQALDGVQTRDSWAFSFWGGDFFFYTAAKTTTSTVNRFATSSTAAISTPTDNAGFRIVGAGVSTCAPTEPPK